MAELPVIADTYRCALTWAASSQYAVNVFHVRASGPLPTALEVGAAVKAAWDGDQQGVMSSAAHGTQLAVTPLDGSSATAFTDVSADADFEGVNATAIVPAFAAVVSLRTALRGPSHRGRIYLPFCSEGTMNQGTFESSPYNGLLAAWQAFPAALLAGAESLELVVASYKNETAQGVSNVLVNRVGGTQRRRQQRVVA